ncbi:mitochondrial transcription rescue factor 1 [Hoplias malabaricus]|uniref:mitochondrial transcription rescue factor 1 n=1 Tax=Hoplias malabaricus TaxID=27720 RepID=UPI00346341D4
MQSLSVQALTLRQLGRLNTLQMLSPWSPRTLHARQLWGSAAPLTKRSVALTKLWDSPKSWTLQQTRLKSSKKKSRHGAVQEVEEEEEDEEASDYEDELPDDPSLPKDYKDSERVVQSLRFDLVIKAGLDITRHKIEDAFYDNKLRLNGQQLVKKNKIVKVGDTLDLIMGVDKELDMMTLKRVILKKVLGETKDGEKQKVIVRSWKHLRIPRQENYRE